MSAASGGVGDHHGAASQAAAAIEELERMHRQGGATSRGSGSGSSPLGHATDRHGTADEEQLLAAEDEYGRGRGRTMAEARALVAGSTARGSLGEGAAGGNVAGDDVIDGRGGIASYMFGLKTSFGGAANKRKADALYGADAELRRRGRVVSMLFYLAMCHIAAFLGSFLWTYFLILQGRYCTSADKDGVGIYVPASGDLIAPGDSLILRYVPGCTFGSAWQVGESSFQ
jgi:hypothetical protein